MTLHDPHNGAAVFDLLANMHWPAVLENAAYMFPEVRLDAIPAPPPIGLSGTGEPTAAGKPTGEEPPR